MILEARNLRIRFPQGEAVSGVDLSLTPGRTTCLVGESGSGKSLTALSLLNLLPSTAALTADTLSFEGKSLMGLSESGWREVRGGGIGIVFQEPATALNPIYTVGFQVAEALRDRSRSRVVELFRQVGISDPERRYDEYPHQLSGGMRQRVMIAMALAGSPRVLIADEPTTALDVTIQAQILNLLRGLQKKMGMALLLITHDLGVVKEMADEVLVLYAGQVVEQGSVRDIFERARHPYTRALLAAMPKLEKSDLVGIPGRVPEVGLFPSGCRFEPRCPLRVADCREKAPSLVDNVRCPVVLA